MRSVLLITFLLCGFCLLAQTDSLWLHNGKELSVKIIRVNEFTILYKYTGEDAEQVISRVAVARIKYSSGREEDISEKVVINGKEDWEKVTVIIDKSQLTGLKKGGDVQGKTTAIFSQFNAAAYADKRSLRKLLEAAAELKCPFVYIVADKDAKGGYQSGAFGAQSNKRGIAYNY